MSKLQEVSNNIYRKIQTGADYNVSLNVLRDVLVIVNESQASSRIVPTSFWYNIGTNELEVFVNGNYKRCIETINGTNYGDYAEYSNFVVQFEPGIIDATSQVRFRVTSANYSAQRPQIGSIETLQTDVNGNTNNIIELGKEVFGENISLYGDGESHPRVIGIMGDNDTTPDLSAYRTWKTATDSISVSITDFINCKEDDIRYIIFSNDLTTIQSNGNIKLQGGLDFNGNQYDSIQLIYDGSIWYELTRSLNS